MIDHSAITSISDLITEARSKEKAIVFISGKFNILHPGHTRLLKFAAEQGDVVLVGLVPDDDKDVSVPGAMRIEALKSLTFVDHAFVMSFPLVEIIRQLRPDVVVKGKEYQERENEEESVLKSYGGRLLFGSGDVFFSSFSLLKREYFETNYSSIIKPKDFPVRRKFDIRDLKEVLEKFRNLRVLVIGDLIVDTYINCEALGMSQEDPTIVVSPIEQTTFVGGAGIVAAHARGLGANVSFVTVCGDDESANFARSKLADYDVDACLFTDTARPTTNKQRFRARGKTLLRVNHLRQLSVDAALSSELIAAVEDRLPQTDLLLFSDFNYGCLPQPVVDSICEKAAARGIMMAADSQASSQAADISRFRGMTLITPTEREARMALKDAESGLIMVAEELRKTAKAEHVVVTLGEEGLLMYVNKEGQLETDRLPAFNSAPKDVAGAGDSFFTCTSMALCAGIDVWRSVYLGALAAGCQVSRVGNTPLTQAELATEIDYKPS
ncbi:PfkB family carbohydrate kinase [Pontivivens ytuae]|uniref:Adenylyltransferase/cytidyltransferase family protein n=1 Tax=Pontivivens ytuae TaxID=2789856 RepID=A0A7S9LP35_9RHOB|nr:PfkB family carbohydrate kinase [Pontivivens ytuae]QPH52618.1 adenylyltransferase/cytidyltransferase family protein [Pontivivens ytuae]